MTYIYCYYHLGQTALCLFLMSFTSALSSDVKYHEITNTSGGLECNPLYNYGSSSSYLAASGGPNLRNIIPRYCASVILGAVVAVGFIGNILVLASMSMGRRKVGITSILLSSLAVSDLIIVSLYVPLEMETILDPVFKRGKVICFMMPYIGLFAKSTSALMLLAISMERYFVILYPLTSRTFLTRQRTLILVASIWVLAFILAGPIVPLMEYDYTEYPCGPEFNYHTCHIKSEDWLIHFFLYNFAFLYTIPLTAMGYCNSHIIITLIKSNKRSQKMQSMKCLENSGYNSIQPLRNSSAESERTIDKNSVQDNGRGDCSNNIAPEERDADDDPFPEIKRKRIKARRASRRNKLHSSLTERKKVIWMLISVIILYAVCWFPEMLRGILLNVARVDGNEYGMLIFRLFCTIMYCANSAVNPIAYGFMSKNFRQSIVYGLKRCFNREGERRRRASDLRSAFTLSTRENRNSVTSSSFAERNNIAYTPVSRM